MTDLDDLPLPPHRPLPDDARDRIRAAVLPNLRPNRTRPNHARTPLAVAASVAVLAVGTAIVVRSAAPPNTAAPFDPAAAAANLDRCWRALGGKQSTVPARETWVPVLVVSDSGRTVTAARAAGRPLFCETTDTTVAVSNPNAAPHPIEGTGTAAMLVSPTGSIGGVVDPQWRQMELEVHTEGVDPVWHQPNVIKDGLFVGFGPTVMSPANRISVRRAVPEPDRYSWQDLPAAPAPLVPTAVDAVPPPVDRTAELAALFDECKAGSAGSMDWTGWEPVVMAGPAPNKALLLRAGTRALTCATGSSFAKSGTDPGQGHSYYPWPPGTIAPAEPLSYVTWPDVGSEKAVFGLVRPDVAAMELIGPGGNPVEVPLEGDHFAMTFPNLGFDWPALTVVLRNGSGAEVYRGPLPHPIDH